jgi:hypothetical protein
MLRKATLLLFLVSLTSLSVIAQTKNVLLTGLDTNKTVTLVINGAERPLGIVGAGGDIGIALDPNLDAALDPNKNYAVYKTSCSRYVIVVQNSEDERRCRRDNENAKPDEPCGRCVPVGLILKGQYSSAADTGRAATSAGAAAVSAASGFSLGLYGFGSGSFTSITNAPTAIPIIDDRATAANYNQPRNISVDEKSSSSGFGGGVNLAWGTVPVGMRVGVVHEPDRKTPSQVVDIQRDLNGLIFQQFGSSRIGSTTLFLGPTVHLPAGLVVTGGPAISWWDLELSQTGSLRALCPNPCMVVRTDDVRETVEGRDVGLHLGAEFYPGNRWFGFYLAYLRMTYENAYDPTRALAWPQHWKDRNIFVGGVIRTKGGRPRLLFRR